MGHGLDCRVIPGWNRCEACDRLSPIEQQTPVFLKRTASHQKMLGIPTKSSTFETVTTAVYVFRALTLCHFPFPAALF
jgi:hypothetical protein